MPYIIETSRGCGYCTHCGYGSEPSAECLHKTSTRTAVATLEEANRAAYEHQRSADSGIGRFNAQTVPESGSTVGPLPDGTVIEVRHAPLNPFADPAAWCEIYNRHHATA
jgi:hypothetical protein